MLPVRYQVKEDDDGRYLTCIEASNISVRIDRSLSVSASSARKYPKGTIFLDGAAKGEPFIDSSRGVYNLDHHEGCVRSFTLSTCEQGRTIPTSTRYSPSGCCSIIGGSMRTVRLCAKRSCRLSVCRG
jgi:hypothetical protein